AALVGVDGRIDWWAAPSLDSPPALGALLDPERGGYLALAPTGQTSSRPSYMDQTNVLVTVQRTSTGTVQVVDSLNTGTAGRLPWTELARRVEGVEGTVDMEWALVAGDRMRTCRPWVTAHRGHPVIHAGDQTLVVVTDQAGEVHRDAARAFGRFRLRAGERALVAVVHTDAEPAFIPSPEAISARIDRTVEGWRRWSATVALPSRHAAAVLRSALALKLLLNEHTGAIAAAATTSLPESVGGHKNWDYRYSWVRDSSFALDALIRLGLHEEVHGAVSWLLGAIRRNGHDLRVFYSLDGDAPRAYEEVEVPGWRHSRPVRSGNAAAEQVQLGSYGDLFDTVYRYADEGHVLDQGTARMLADLAESCCNQWLDKDSGIWELEDLQHYTISKIRCWTALERAASLARDGQLPDDRLERWQVTADAIHRWVDDNCWSKAKCSYSFHAQTDRLDAAVLLAGRAGFDQGERLSATIEAVRAELARGPFVYRYSGMEKEEGAFVACTFWLVDALVRVGRRGEAEALMEEAVGLMSDTGLLAEQIDPATGEFLGNIPQGLSHLALINAATCLDQSS
ncbi:MAG: glycoside hydrolase family 15 protein, partial [Acidimicrobiales bacterium]